MNNFVHFGGFLTSYFEKDINIILEKLNRCVNRVITKDLPRLANLDSENIDDADCLLCFLALQQSGEVSKQYC